MDTTKLTNPKDVLGQTKLPLHLWPVSATTLGSLALLDGAGKYGRANWRIAGVRASIYVDAAMRHITAWFEGQDADPESELPHLAHALACLAIIVDAQAAGMLRDDRLPAGGAAALRAQLTPHVKRLLDKHAHRDVKHYTIADLPDDAAVPARKELSPANRHTPGYFEVGDIVQCIRADSNGCRPGHVAVVASLGATSFSVSGHITPQIRSSWARA